MSDMKMVTPPGWPAARGYSYAVVHQGRVNVAGVIAMDMKTQEVVPGGFAEQWSKVWENVAEILSAAGTTPDKVVAIRVFVTSLEAYRDARRELGAGWGAVFGDHLPAITLVEVSGLVLADCLLEAEVEATLD
jgi:enamine deaminase RidA (YjgF/YER057c/UK114 family)